MKIKGGYWRQKCSPIIAKVLSESRPEELKRALYDAYPFGPRAHYPYKIWLDEIARQTGRKPPLGTRHSGSRLDKSYVESNPDQVEFW